MIQSVKFFIQIAIYKSRKKIIIYKKEREIGDLPEPLWKRRDGFPCHGHGREALRNRCTDFSGKDE